MATYKVPILAELPSERMDSYNHANFTNYLNWIHAKNANIGFGAGTYAHGVTAVNNAYMGGTYSPIQNRIYFIPFEQADVANWHYIDCSDGSVNVYAHGLGGDIPVDGAYFGGVYSPTQDRIYLVPYNQANVANWHYIDCATGTIVTYAHGLGGDTPVNAAYRGGVYSPTQNRIYLIPYGQAHPDNTKWHYIDCSDGSIVAYVHGVTTVNNAYIGGVYSPTQNRIYLIPYGQSDVANWHYINCATGAIVAYAHGLGGDIPVNNAYFGGVYSPTQDRIYLVPYNQANVANWHYIDCSDGSVNVYAHGLGGDIPVVIAYRGGVYSPTQDRIYLVPYNQANVANWHYIDCSDGSVVAYAHGATVANAAYTGGTYSPIQNRIYLIPYGQADVINWHYIQEYSTAEISPSIAASPLFNKF